jgi:iron(III) transport system substrate-binding protein
VNDLRRTKAYLLLIFGMGLLLLFWQRMTREKLVVYCAHDAVFAESILQAFERQTGIPVAVKYDTEATKSLGLVEQIVQDGDKPRCDVFWNNEMLGTLDLAERGRLEPYKGSGWQRIPPAWRDDDGRWAGFAARLRVRIRNTERGDFLEPLLERANGESSADGGTGLARPAPPLHERQYARFAMAKPLYGTTLTHYAVLWDVWGPEKVRTWHLQSRSQGLRETNGNAGVKDLVATGACGAGYTDTDDYFEAKDGGKPVASEPVPVGNGATICIPNTVAIVRGTKRLEDARKLADFLLSARTEMALAKSKSRQIPIGALDAKAVAELPVEVRELIPHAARGYPLKGLLPARNECLQWLKAEYVK